jgi:cold shock CspA family protein
VRALQNMGCRVELMAFQNISYLLRCEADFFMSGYLIPGLLPRVDKGPLWGDFDSRVRGTCYHFNTEKGFGFLRYIVSLDNLAMTDPRGDDSPYRQAFFHYSNARLTNAELNQLPSRDMVFEFTLERGRVDGEMAAKDVELVNRKEPYLGLEQRAEIRPAAIGDVRPVGGSLPAPSAVPSPTDPVAPATGAESPRKLP